MYIYTVCSVAHLVTPVYLYKVVFFATVCVCGVGGVCVCYVFCHVSPQCVCDVCRHPCVSPVYL